MYDAVRKPLQQPYDSGRTHRPERVTHLAVTGVVVVPLSEVEMSRFQSVQRNSVVPTIDVDEVLVIAFDYFVRTGHKETGIIRSLIHWGG